MWKTSVHQDRYQVTVAYQELFPNSLRGLTFRMSGKYTSTIQDLRTIAGQSSKEDLIAGGTGDRRGRQACFFSAMTHWRRHCPISQISPRTNLDWCTANIPNIPAPDAVYTFDVKIAQDRGLTFHQTCSCAIILNNTMPSDALVELTGTIRRQRSPRDTQVTRRYISLGTEENPVQPFMESARRNPTRPYMERARRNRWAIIVTEHQTSCVGLRVQGEPDQLTADEEQKKKFCNSVAGSGISAVP